MIPLRDLCFSGFFPDYFPISFPCSFQGSSPGFYHISSSSSTPVSSLGSSPCFPGYPDSPGYSLDSPGSFPDYSLRSSALCRVLQGRLWGCFWLLLQVFLWVLPWVLLLGLHHIFWVIRIFRAILRILRFLFLIILQNILQGFSRLSLGSSLGSSLGFSPASSLGSSLGTSRLSGFSRLFSGFIGFFSWLFSEIFCKVLRGPRSYPGSSSSLWTNGCPHGYQCGQWLSSLLSSFSLYEHEASLNRSLSKRYCATSSSFTFAFRITSYSMNHKKLVYMFLKHRYTQIYEQLHYF